MPEVYTLENVISEMRKTLYTNRPFNPNSYDLNLDFPTAELILQFLLELQQLRGAQKQYTGTNSNRTHYDYETRYDWSKFSEQFKGAFTEEDLRKAEEDLRRRAGAGSTTWDEIFGRKSRYQQEQDRKYDDAFRQYRERQQGNSNRARPNQAGKKPWYEVLGVPPSASKATIKAAWRKLAKQYHPDKPENRTKEAEEMIRQINIAKDEGLAGARA